MARLLSPLTLVWLGIEGVIGVIAGVLAGSVALVAFGLDSAILCAILAVALRSSDREHVLWTAVA